MRRSLFYSRATGAVCILLFVIVLSCIDYTPLVSWYQERSFGKTHFIVGHSPVGQSKNGTLVVPGKPGVCKVLFSPDDDLMQELLTLIDGEKESIKIAIFTFTDKNIAQALLDAHQRGVRIEVVADAAYLRDPYSKVAFLASHDIPIYTYDPRYKKARHKKQELLSIMHNKFVIFGSNTHHGALVWTGSFNFTRSATLRNQENVVIFNDATAIEQYQRQFECLKTRCGRWQDRV